MKRIVLIIGLIAFIGGGFVAYSSSSLSGSKTVQVDGEKCPNCGKENCDGSCKKEHKCSHDSTSTQKHEGCQKAETKSCCKKGETQKSCCKKGETTTAPKSCCKKTTETIEEKK